MLFVYEKQKKSLLWLLALNTEKPGGIGRGHINSHKSARRSGSRQFARALRVIFLKAVITDLIYSIS